MANPNQIADYQDIIAFKPSVSNIPNIENLVNTIYTDQVAVYMDPQITGDSTRTISTYLFLHLIQLTWPDFFQEGTMDSNQGEAPAGPITRVKARNQEIQYQAIAEATWDTNFFLANRMGRNLFIHDTKCEAIGGH